MYFEIFLSNFIERKCGQPSNNKKNKIPQALQGSSDISILQFVAYITLFSLQDLAVMF
jgi:hypothetical protein